jgi:beta-lactamase class D
MLDDLIRRKDVPPMGVLRSGWAGKPLPGPVLVSILFLIAGVRSVLPGEPPLIRSGLVIETNIDARGELTAVFGEKSWLDRSFAPASTFKVVLALAGLASGGIDLKEVLVCRDAHLGSQPLSLALPEALRLSSNDFFLQIGPRIGASAIEATLSTVGLVSRTDLPKWRRGGWTKVHRGGGLQVTPRAQHQFMTHLAAERLRFPPGVLAALRQAMRWPSSHPDVEVFGKTGAAGGAVWFIGYGKRAGQWKAVTVFLAGGVARRPEAIALFYRRFGLAPPES